MKLIHSLPDSARPDQLVGLDIEIFKMSAPRLHRPTGTFACMSIAFEDGRVFQVDTIKDMRQALKIVNKGKWVFQNMLFDVRHLRRWTEIPQRFIWDTMVVEQDLFGGYYESFGLDALVRRWLNKELPKDTRKKFVDSESMTKEMMEYAATDALSTVKVARKQMDYLAKEQCGMVHYTGIDEPAMWAILDMPPAHVEVDRWLAHAKRCDAKGKRLEAALGFNVKSNPQVLKVLREAGCQVDTTGEDTLRFEMEHLGEHSKAYKLVEAILEARMYRDMASKYGTQWIEKNVEGDGLVYADWKVTGADQTGRMACADPNLQNIPVREQPVYRSFFTAVNGCTIISDVKQQEPCITAHLSQDPVLMDDAGTGDVYKPISLALDISRDDAKAVFLGSTYGLTKYGLAKKQRISVETADRFMLSFYRRYRGVDIWVGQQRLQGKKIGYVYTASGRRCWLSPYNKRAQNNAINSPVQGTAADWTKRSLADLHSYCQAASLPFACDKVIHDERTLDVPPGLSKKYVKLDTEAWMNAGKMLIPSVPVRVEVYLGEHWGAKK